MELETEIEKDGKELSEQQTDELCVWMRDTLSSRVTIVRVSSLSLSLHELIRVLGNQTFAQISSYHH